MDKELELLLDEIRQVRWELASGAYAGCSDETINNVVGHLMELEEQAEEITASLINPEDLPF
jgi:hypothetical protein